jgi:hypothetical protein
MSTGGRFGPISTGSRRFAGPVDTATPAGCSSPGGPVLDWSFTVEGVSRVWGSGRNPASVRAQVVRLARSGRRIDDLAAEYGPSPTMIRAWVRADRAASRSPTPASPPPTRPCPPNLTLTARPTLTPPSRAAGRPASCGGVAPGGTGGTRRSPAGSAGRAVRPAPAVTPPASPPPTPTWPPNSTPTATPASTL